jgi:hypothetical protein
VVGGERQGGRNRKGQPGDGGGGVGFISGEVWGCFREFLWAAWVGLVDPFRGFGYGKSQPFAVYGHIITTVMNFNGAIWHFIIPVTNSDHWISLRKIKVAIGSPRWIKLPFILT